MLQRNSLQTEQSLTDGALKRMPYLMYFEKRCFEKNFFKKRGIQNPQRKGIWKSRKRFCKFNF